MKIFINLLLDWIKPGSVSQDTVEPMSALRQPVWFLALGLRSCFTDDERGGWKEEEEHWLDCTRERGKDEGEGGKSGPGRPERGEQARVVLRGEKEGMKDGWTMGWGWVLCRMDGPDAFSVTLLLLPEREKNIIGQPGRVKCYF